MVDIALRGAAAAARAYLDTRDRVGFITYRYRARWLAPGHGQRHYYRIAEAMLTQDRDWTADTGFSRLPRQALPPGALILVFTPLMDPRLVETLRDLRQRGFAVLIVDVLNGEPERGPGPGRPAGPADLADGAAGDPVLPARAGHPRGALGRGAEPGPVAGPADPAGHGDAPMTSLAGRVLTGAAGCGWLAGAGGGGAAPSGSPPRPACSARPAWPGRRRPPGRPGRAGPLLTVLAACCVAGGIGQLATATVVPPGPGAYPGLLARVGPGAPWTGCAGSPGPRE